MAAANGGNSAGPPSTACDVQSELWLLTCCCWRDEESQEEQGKEPQRPSLPTRTEHPGANHQRVI